MTSFRVVLNCCCSLTSRAPRLEQTFMARTSGRFVIVLLTLALSSTLFAQEQAGLTKEQDAPKEYVGEGVVVAFQKYNRACPLPRRSMETMCTAAINGNYRGPWGNWVEGWNDNTPNVVPDWI